ncbi:MAG TPA: hypothetical protein VMB78_02190, partial [Dissulfurispiraceae bacterium]|nr:hypothetical protein [Dissulfurispiraceae bacterium]
MLYRYCIVFSILIFNLALFSALPVDALTLTEFSAGISANSGLQTITAGSDGNLWFVEFDGNRIARITPNGVVSEFSSGISPDSQPVGIAAGSDGNLWFTEANANNIGRITPSGGATEYPVTTAGSAPWDIASG